MKVLLVDVDSKIPNLALMKLSAWHKLSGDEVGFNVSEPDLVYASVIFKKNRHLTDGLKMFYPDAEIRIGGSGYSLASRLPDEVERITPDYSLYPEMDYSMGFSSRGCIRNCYFCVVPQKEGKHKPWQHPSEFVRHNKVMLLDNNWYANREWFFETSEWLILNNVAVDATQGMDIRLLDDEITKQLKRLKWCAPMHFAFDSDAVEASVERGIECLVRNGINVRQNVRFYVYVDSDDEYDSGVRRCRWLKAHNTTPFVMFNIDKKRTERIKHLQRWANLAWIFWKIDIDEYGVA